MKCFICKQNNNPWLVLKNENINVDLDGKNIYDEIHICSYLCTKKCSEFLPKKYSHLVLNKEDFCYLKPITKIIKTKFEYLTFDEIQDLDDDQKENYYKQKDIQFELNSDMHQIHHELELEDQNTFDLENQQYSSDSELSDDY
jgi:hypothetical protein